MKIFALKFLLGISFVSCLSFSANAQRTINVDSSYSLPTKTNSFFSSEGQPYVNVKFARVVDGSPFFVEKWNQGYVSTREGVRLRDITLRLNLVDQQLHYLKDGVEYITDQPLNEVLIDDKQTGKLYVFRSGFPPVQHATSKTFYLALAEGEVLLLKHIRKIITESTPFGSATTQQTIKNAETYYIWKKGAMIKIKNDKQSLLSVLENKKQELETFINENNINFRSEEDLIKCINYYNTL
jgi:hypothetical protein